MMSRGQLLVGQFVDRRRQALGQPTAVHENHRRMVSPNQLDQTRVDGRPDRRYARSGSRSIDGGRIGGQPGHIFHRHFHSQLHRLASTSFDDAHRPRRGRGCLVRGRSGSAQQPRNLVQRPLCGGQSNPLQWPLTMCGSQLL